MVSPLGARCRTPLGGLYRSPLGALACPGCPDELEVTFSGVTPCACRDVGANSYVDSWNSDLNGTHAFTLTSVVDEVCTYTLDDIATIDTDQHSGSGCGGSPAATTSYSVTVTVTYNHVTNKVTEISSGIYIGGFSFPTEAFAWSGSEDLGVALSNSNSCLTNTTFAQASGGTATVSLP